MKSLAVFLLLFILLATTSFPVQADIAPPFQPPGSNLFPETEGTQVRMVSEIVVIEVKATAPAGSLGQARVTASFSMRNLGSESETMGVLFPLSTNDGFSNYPEITDFTARVGGKAAPTRRTTNPFEEGDLPWAEFDVTFPPGEDVLIEVAYTLEGTGEYPYISFTYFLHTGAGWADTIGNGEVLVKFPYDISSQNVYIDSGPGWGDTTPGAIISSREMRWSFEDLEPDYANDISVAIVMPSAWAKFLTEQANVQKNPQDGEAWGRLGKVAKEISRLRRSTREDPGGLELFTISQDAYQHAVDLLPEDALWHAGYAELLFDHYYWSELWASEKPGMLNALEELWIAYQLKPNEPFIVDLLDEIRYALPEGISMTDGQVTFLWLTSTPTFIPSPTQTITPSPTSARPTASASPQAADTSTQQTAESMTAETTAAPLAEPVDTPETKDTPFPLCGGMVFPLFFVLWIKNHRTNPLTGRGGW